MPLHWVMDGVDAHIKHILDEIIVLFFTCVFQAAHCLYH